MDQDVAIVYIIVARVLSPQVLDQPVLFLLIRPHHRDFKPGQFGFQIVLEITRELVEEDVMSLICSINCGGEFLARSDQIAESTSTAGFS